MASSEGKKPEQGGNGPSYQEILKQLGLSFLASVLPLISARLVGLFDRKRRPVPAPEISKTGERAVHDRGPDPVPIAHASGDEPPDLPPLTELPPDGHS